MDTTQLELYQAKMGELSTKGTPWSPSQYDRQLSTIYIQERGRYKIDDMIELNQPYILMQGTNGFYPNGKATSYFTRGSIVVALEHLPDAYDQKYVRISIKGSTFQVTGDGGFANRGATSVRGQSETECRIPLNRLFLVRPEDALKSFP